jgi:ParB/RepB/Spo0J family partition protein
MSGRSLNSSESSSAGRESDPSQGGTPSGRAGGRGSALAPGEGHPTQGGPDGHHYRFGRRADDRAAEIRTDGNVRQQLLAEDVDALARSIKLLGQLTPVSVRPAEAGGYVLIAGHNRCAALASLGETQVRAEIRADDSQEESERAAENIVRSGLNPYEEAVAVRAMLDRGLTVDGAAQALGWNRARVTARVKLLELPELAQQMIGDGRLPLSSVEQLHAIGAVSPALLEALIDYPGRRQRVGGRATDPRAGLGARRRAAQQQHQGVRGAPGRSRR